LAPDDYQDDTSWDPNQTIYDQIEHGRSIVERTKNPENRARMERTQLAMEEVATNFQELHMLSEEDQLTVLDRVVDKLFDQDPEMQKNIALITEARTDGRASDVQEIVAEQKKRYEQLRREVAFDLGIEIEDVEVQNDQYRDVLIEKVQAVDTSDPEEIMKALGFFIYDERKGEYRFNFPDDLFPPHLVDKWRQYEKLVVEHERAHSKLKRGLNENEDEIMQRDIMRRLAHNNLARSVQEFLHLESWDFKRCRDFVEKMTKKRFPTIETNERKLTAFGVVDSLRLFKTLGDSIHPYHDETD